MSLPTANTSVPLAHWLTPRHALAWCSLSASAGMVNSLAFQACNQFVSNVTGTITTLTLSSSGNVLRQAATVVTCFVFGAFSSSVLFELANRRSDSRPVRTALLMVSFLLASAASLGLSGLLGAYGVFISSDELRFVALLAFAMGLQNASVSMATSMLVRTTHMTGPATDLGLSLGLMLTAKEQMLRSIHLQNASIRALTIVSFVLGAALAVQVHQIHSFSLFFAPALLVLFSALTWREPTQSTNTP